MLQSRAAPRQNPLLAFGLEDLTRALVPAGIGAVLVTDLIPEEDAAPPPRPDDGGAEGGPER